MADVPIPQFSPSQIRSAAKRLYYRSPFGIESFFRQQLKITTKEVGEEARIPFIPNAVQSPILRDDIKQLETRGYIRDLLAKCRQPGGSTYGSAMVSNRVSLFNGIYAFIVAQDRGTVGRIFNMHDIFWRNMAEDIRPPLKYYTKNEEMVFGESEEDESGVDSMLRVGEAKNIHLGVGRTVHCLHMSEVCRYPSSDPIKESLIPACSKSPGTVRIIESAAHFGGGADWFRYQCDRAIVDKAKERESEYHFHFLEWWRLPEYSIPLERGDKLKFDSEERMLIKKYNLTSGNIKWRRAMLAELEGDLDAFHLSYPMSYDEMWVSKQTIAFPHDRLMELHSMLRPPIKRFRIEPGSLTSRGKPIWSMYEHDQGEFWVWHMPQPGRTYDVGADVGEGYQDGDWSVAEIIERGSNIQCAEYRAHLIPSDFAEVLAVIGRFYNMAQIGPEVNNQGLETVHELAKIYPNIYIFRKQDQIAPKLTGLMGWKTQYDSKLIMVGLGHKRLYHRQVQIFSKVLWDELRNFGRDYTESGMLTYRAVTGHDDCVIAWLISLKISDDENFEQYRDVGAENKPKQQDLDPAYHDLGWQKVLEGGSSYERLTGPWN